MKLGDTSFPSSPLPGWGCDSSAHGVPHTVAGLISCLQDVGGWSLADPAALWLNALAMGWSCCCVAHHHGGSISNRLILLSLWHSLPLVLSWSYHCGPHYPCQQGAGTTVMGFITLLLCWSCHHGVTMYKLLLWLWFHHIDVGLVMSSWGSLCSHWADPAVLCWKFLRHLIRLRPCNVDCWNYQALSFHSWPDEMNVGKIQGAATLQSDHSPL